MSTAEVLEDAGFDFSDLDDDSVEATPGPLSGSRTRRTSAAREPGQRKTRGPSARKLNGLQVKLSEQMFMAGTMIGFGLPVTGYYTCQESDRFTKAVVQLASRRTEWVEALEHLADIQPGLIIGRTVVGLGAALAVDRGRVEPDRRFVQMLGVTAAYHAVHAPASDIEEGNAYKPPPAGSFIPV